MSLVVYNTITRKKEEFKSIHEGLVGMYVCGPTVYGYPHLGHAKSYVSFDIIYRYLMHLGYKVKYVQNITDVGHLVGDAESGEDKIERIAKLESIDPVEIAYKFENIYFEDMRKLNVLKPSISCRATGHIIEIIEDVQTLIDKGYAYATKEGNVYYRINKFTKYGSLSNRTLDNTLSGERIEVATDKENPADFALWKKAENGHIMKWPSPWGEGYPGWHIECSEMSKKYIGDTIDIHAGGEDLIFPHHENEIAQSEAANDKPFAKYWMHNAFLNIDNRKMSKSLGNFFTVREISEKYHLQLLRFFILSAHYRSPLNFSADLMEAAKNGYERIVTSVDNLKFLLDKAADTEMTGEEKNLLTEAQGFETKFDEAMDDDFNTADALAAIFELVKFVNSNAKAESSKAFLEALKQEIVTLSDICGLIVDKKAEMLDSDIEALIEERQAARKAKNFARADEIRDELLAKGIVLEDTREGVKWKRA